MDIFKLLKTLNSAQASWQISLAIVLGMLSGFLPLTTPLNFLILFVAFTINIPLAVFFFMSVVFSLLALILDPLFATLGYEVLTNDALKPLFTSMYNSTPMLWTSFNYTILMGSLITSTLLAFALFPLLNILIDKYRDVLEAKFKESKYFSWLNPYSEKKLSKKPGIFRLWAAALFLIIVALISTIILLLIDPVLKYALEYSLSKATQRTVQINSVNSQIFETTLEIHGISLISNSTSDMDDIEIDKVKLQLNSSHLLAKKYDFEVISFGNITLNTNLQKRAQTENKTTSTTSTSTNIKAPKLPSIDKLIAKEGLKSVKAAKEIQANIKVIQEKWSEIGTGSEQKDQIASMRMKVKNLESQAKKVKSISQIASIVEEADQLKKEINSFQDEIKNINKEYQKDKKLISKYIADIKTLPLEDYNHLKNKYSLDQNGAMNLIGTHFSSSLEKYLRMANEYYSYVKPYISSQSEEETPEQKRMKGEWIKYANHSNYPNFVIQKLNANIIKSNKNFDLNIKDISDNQRIYKKPITGSVVSKSKEYKLLNVNFEHNELKENVLTTIESSMKAYKLANYSAIESLSINNSIIDEKSNLIITDFTALDAKISANFIKTTLVYSASSSLTDKTIHSILANIKTFKIDSSVGGTLQNPEISLNSDIDKKITKGLKKQVSKEIQKYKKKLKLAINQEFKNQLGDINLGEFNDVEKVLKSGLNDSKSLEKIIEKNISKKAMQKQIESKVIKGFSDKLKFF